jgi:hypothetical protein
MTSYTKKVFYVNHPIIEGKQSFALSCPDNSEQFVVLGCYRLNQQGIFILQVNNTDLAGIEQVTAAYETLHAIYQRLSPSQQAKLNAQLKSYENNQLSDPVIKAQIANFRKTESGEVYNEMTSLFGTDVANLPASLTKFYAQYFNNRQNLVNLYTNYESAFTTRQNQISSLDSQLQSLQAQINSNESSLSSQYSNILTTQTSLNNLKSSNQIAQYNSGVPSYNAEVDSYNQAVNTTQDLIDQYNNLAEQHNSIALEEQQLTQAITSSAKPISN